MRRNTLLNLALLAVVASAADESNQSPVFWGRGKDREYGVRLLVDGPTDPVVAGHHVSCVLRLHNGTRAPIHTFASAPVIWLAMEVIGPDGRAVPRLAWYHAMQNGAAHRAGLARIRRRLPAGECREYRISLSRAFDLSVAGE